MNPIWDYVKKVEPHLRGGQRPQVAGALYARLKAKKEALEKSLGRPATEEEIASLLLAEGAPADVGARLSIGPDEHDLVTRYLLAVERRLPEKTARDIVAELREAVLAKIEAREAGLGRAANADEIADVLKAFGPPAVVAARYEGRMHLIGPNLYPWFWPTQRTAVGVTIAVIIGLAALRALASERPWSAVIASVDDIFMWGMLAFANVTLAFILIERTADPAKLAAYRWDPKTLPREDIRKPKSLFESGVTLFFDVLFILFWVQLLPFPNEFPVRDGASVSLLLSPAWSAVYWPVMALGVMSAAAHALDLVRPAWSRVRSAISIVGYAGGLAVLWKLFQSPPLLTIVPRPGATPEDAARAFALIEMIFSISLGIAAVAWAIAIGIEVSRQIRAGRVAEPKVHLAA